MEISKEQAEEFAKGPQPTQEDLDNIVDIVSDSPLGANIVQTDFVKEAKKRAKKRKGTSFGFENRSDPIFEKTVDIFELIKKTKIQLDIKNYDTGEMTEVYDGYDNDNHSITICKRGDENIKTSLERGLAYIAFDTSKRQFKASVGELSEFAKTEHQGKIQELLMTAYSSLEARRVNSCMGHVFKGFDERHKEADLVHAKKLFGDDFKLNDPVSALQCAQLGLNDLVEKSEFKRANQYMKDVERTTGEGSIILTNEYVEEVVKPWYLENFGKEPEGQDGNGKGGKNGNPAPQGAGGNSGEGETDPDADGETDQEGEGNGNPKYDDKHEDAKDWKGKEPTDKQKEYIKKYGPQDEPVPKTRGGAYDLVSDLMNNQPTKTDKKEPEEVPDPTTDELKKVIRETKSRRKGINVGENMQGKETNFDVKKGIEEAKKDGEKMIDTIEEALADVARGQPNENKRQIMFKKGELEALVGGVNVVKNLPVIEQPQVDKHTVNKLKSIFKRLKSKPKTETSDSGQDIDVELFIKDEIEGGTDFLMDDVEQQGFAVVIGIDESGSMGGQPIQIARNLAGTLYKAFENMPNVEIHVVGWQSAGSHCDVHIIKRYQDVGTLYAGGGTPFRQATLYLGEYMRRLPQKKKLMFQITDGGVSYDKQTMDYLSQLRKQGGNVVTGMCISYYQGGDPSMRDLFGKDNYLSFDSMASVNKVLIEDITKTFVRYMRG